MGRRSAALIRPRGLAAVAKRAGTLPAERMMAYDPFIA